MKMIYYIFFFFSSRRRHTRCYRDWSSDVCSSDLVVRADDVESLESQVHLEEPRDIAVIVCDQHEMPFPRRVLLQDRVHPATYLSPGRRAVSPGETTSSAYKH